MAAGLEYFKLMRQSECHNGLQYVDGLNVDPQPWSTETECSAGGIYFCTRPQLVRWLRLYADLAWVRSVTLPPDARVHEEDGKFKADRVVLGPRQAIGDWCAAQTVEWQLTLVRLDPGMLPYVWQRPEVRLAALERKGSMLMLMPPTMQTPQLCMAAVCQDGLALLFVLEQTPELCLAAVRQNGLALQNVEDHTPELCLAAVQQNGNALQFVTVQTPELCMAAVRSNGFALQYVHAQTRELCLAAIQHNWAAIRCYKGEITRELLAASEAARVAQCSELF